MDYVSWTFTTIPNFGLKGLPFKNRDALSACHYGADVCNGLELELIQSVRGSSLIPDKPAVARLFLRWPPRDEIFYGQVTETDVMVEVWVSGMSVQTSLVAVKRQDQLDKQDFIAMKNSVQFFFLPKKGSGQAEILARITPEKQRDRQVVSFEVTAAWTWAPDLRREIDTSLAYLHHQTYNLLPSSTVKQEFEEMVRKGLRLTEDMLPVTKISTPSVPLQLGVSYTRLFPDPKYGSWVLCGMSKLNVIEALCIAEYMSASYGPNQKFMIAPAPRSIAGATTVGLRVPGAVFIIFDGNKLSESWPVVVAHEVAHAYDIDYDEKDPDPYSDKASGGVEGVAVSCDLYPFIVAPNFPGFPPGWKQLLLSNLPFWCHATLKSHYYDSKHAVNLMYHETMQGTDYRWIKNLDYNHLLTKNFRRRLNAQPSRLLMTIRGYVNASSKEVLFGPVSFRNSTTGSHSSPGSCTMQLMDSVGVVFDRIMFNPGVSSTIYYDNGTASSQVFGTSFAISLHWNDSASLVAVDCGNGTVGTLSRSHNPPTVRVSSPRAGQLVAGVETLAWNAHDTDGDPLQFQVQSSVDNGENWAFMSGPLEDNNLVIETTLFPNIANLLLRVIVTDRFEFGFDTISVQVSNPVVVQQITPHDYEENVSVWKPITVLFSTPINKTSATSSSFYLDPNVEADVAYNSDAMSLQLYPRAFLEYGSRYTAVLTSSLRGENGETFRGHSWSFVTEEDKIGPSVVSSSPRHGDVSVPLNMLIQVSFDEPLDPKTVLVRLVNSTTGTGVPAQLEYSDAQRRAILLPSVNLTEETGYSILVNDSVTDLAGNGLRAAYIANFTTGRNSIDKEVRVVGNFRDALANPKGESQYESLDISLDVEVRISSNYSLSGRLDSETGNPVSWARATAHLAKGVHRVNLRFDGSVIRNSGLDGPYILSSLFFFAGNDSSSGEALFNAFTTARYDVKAFHAMLEFGPLPDFVLRDGHPSTSTFDLRNVTTHAKDSLATVRYVLLENTDQRLVVSIDNSGMLRLSSESDAEFESAVAIEAFDQRGYNVKSTFRVRVARPLPSKLNITYNPEMSIATKQLLNFTVLDELNHVYEKPLDIYMSVSAGAGVSPSNLTTSTGKFEAEVESGSMAGTIVLTARVDAYFEDSVSIKVIGCTLLDQGCTSSNECCSPMACNAGKCSLCKVATTPCEQTSECCSGLTCDGSTAGNRECRACKAVNTACSTTSQCCTSLTCDGSTAANRKCRACKAVNTACQATSQCCTGLTCDGSTTANRKCRACKAANNACSTTSQCCTGLTCDGPTRNTRKCKVCKRLNAACSTTSQCCTGLTCDGPTRNTRKCKVCKRLNAACVRRSECCAGLTCRNRKCSR
jgi:hypothetical protein